LYDQTLEEVLMAAHVHATEPAGLVEMRERSFQQLTTLAEEPTASCFAVQVPEGVRRERWT
jgi:hypothetical protein